MIFIDTVTLEEKRICQGFDECCHFCIRIACNGMVGRGEFVYLNWDSQFSSVCDLLSFHLHCVMCSSVGWRDYPHFTDEDAVSKAKEFVTVPHGTVSSVPILYRFCGRVANCGSGPNPATCSYRDLLEQPIPIHLHVVCSCFGATKADRIE